MLTIPVIQLKDQKESDDSYILEDRSGALGDIDKRLNLRLWWIYSKVPNVIIKLGYII
jgi:hypothetical protein